MLKSTHTHTHQPYFTIYPETIWPLFFSLPPYINFFRKTILLQEYPEKVKKKCSNEWNEKEKITEKTGYKLFSQKRYSHRRVQFTQIYIKRTFKHFWIRIRILFTEFYIGNAAKVHFYILNKLDDAIG